MRNAKPVIHQTWLDTWSFDDCERLAGLWTDGIDLTKPDNSDRYVPQWQVVLAILLARLNGLPAIQAPDSASLPLLNTVQVFGVKDGMETLIGTAPTPARMKARELAREQFGHFEDGDGSDAELCFAAMEQLIEHLEQCSDAKKGTAS